MPRFGWLTPDTTPATNHCRCLVIPNDPSWLSIVSGAIVELTRAYNFEQFGSVTPEECSERFQAMFTEFSEDRMCREIGEVFIWPGEHASHNPQGYAEGRVLRCSGQTLDIADYPDLYDVIGITYGGDDTQFQVPNFDSKFLYQGVAGGIGGEAMHVLTLTEMPSHVHTEGTALPSVGAAITGVPVPSAVPGANSTSPNGGSQGHNNIPPYLSMWYFIQAKH